MVNDENWHSREGALNLVFDEKDKVQYDKDDEKRIADFAMMFGHNAAALATTLANYRDALLAEDSEDSAEVMKTSRAELCEAWAYAQLALSKIAWAIRLDGNEAYAKLINSQMDSTYPLNYKGM